MVPTVGDYLLERLRAWDVRYVFGYPGDGINGILAAWGRADNQPQFIQARHEEMAAFEAVGYAKFTGRVGVCAATSGLVLRHGLLTMLGTLGQVLEHQLAAAERYMLLPDGRQPAAFRYRVQTRSNTGKTGQLKPATRLAAPR